MKILEKYSYTEMIALLARMRWIESNGYNLDDLQREIDETSTQEPICLHIRFCIQGSESILQAAVEPRRFSSTKTIPVL